MIEPGFKHGHELTAAIRRVVAQGPADLAVAYWGNDAVNRLQLPPDLTGYRIACDAFSGFCSPTAIRTLLSGNAEIVDVPQLHAKVYRSANGVVSASANASRRGLSDHEDEPFGLEAGVFDDEDARIEAAKIWFDDLFASGTPITSGEIDDIEDLWKRQRAFRPSSMSLMNAILTRSATLADRKVRAYIYAAGSPTAEAERQYKSNPYFDSGRWERSSEYPFFWGALPSSIAVGDELLCFEADESGITCEGVWKILDRIGQGDDSVWPAARIEVTFARGLGVSDEVCRRTYEAVRSGRMSVDADPMDLIDFADIIAENDGEAVHFARIKNADARSAYRLMLDSSARLNLVPSYTTGRVPAVRWHDADGDYLFSFIPNKQHLLFYVRKRALARAPQLAAQARSLGLESRTNRKGEETLRVRNHSDATALIDWLRATLPL